MDFDFFENGLHFECNGCSLCCRFNGGVVMLSKTDLDSLSKWAELTPEQFIKVYCQWIKNQDGKEYLCLRLKHNGENTEDCIFWDSSIPGCQAYKARPVQCSTYPFWTKLLQNQKEWNNEVKDCPGINKGPLHSKEEILSELEKYKSRVPITR